MSEIVIQAENLGKHYTIGHQAEKGRYATLRDGLVNNARTFWRTTADLLRGKPIIQGNHLEEVWALKDVRCEIQRGEFAPNYGIMETRPFQGNKSSKLWRFPRGLPLMLRRLNLGTTQEQVL